MAAAWRDGVLRPIPLAELADAAAVSEAHLCRLFRQYAECTPAEGLRLLRLMRAAVLLARSDERIQEIAHAVGYEDAFHFSRSFRQVFRLAARDSREVTHAGHVWVPPEYESAIRHLTQWLHSK